MGYALAPLDDETVAWRRRQSQDWLERDNESIAPRSASIGRIVGTLDRSQGGFVPANGVCDEAAAAVRSGSMASSCARRPKVGRPCGVTPTGCPSSSSSLCRRWSRLRRRRGSATTSIGVRGVRSVRASTFAASRRRVEAVRAASCCRGGRLAGRRDRPPGSDLRPGIPRLPRNRGRHRRASLPPHNGRTFPVGGSPGTISDSWWRW